MSQSTVTQPSQDPNKTDADAAWEKEITDAANKLMYQIENLSSGIVSGNNQILVYATDVNGSDMSYEQRALEGFSAVLNYSGDLPTLPVSGLVFTPFSDVAVNTIIYQYYRTNTVQTSAPAANGTYNARTGEWLSTNLWQKTIPAMDNVLTWVSHAVISGSGDSVSYTWSNPVLYYSNRRGTGKIYYQDQQSATPASPVASNYNFATGLITFTSMSDGSTNKWQQAPVTADVTDTLKLMWTCEFVAEQHPGAATATVTFTSPADHIAIASDLKSNNYNGDFPLPANFNTGNWGTQGWAIERASGDAVFNNVNVRGKLNADDISAGTLNVDRIGSNSIGMTQIASTLQSTPYSSGSQGWRIQNNGAAEFNNVVLSRNQQVASWTEDIPNMTITQGYETTYFNVMMRHEIPLAPTSQQIGLGNWGGSADNTYAVATYLDGNTEVFFQGAPQNHRPIVMFGTTCDILPLGQASGYNQTFRFRINFWGRYCWGMKNINASQSTFPCYVRVYKLT